MENTCLVVTRAVIKAGGVRAGAWKKLKIGWSEKAAKVLTLGTQIIRSKPSVDPGEEHYRRLKQCVQRPSGEKEFCVFSREQVCVLKEVGMRSAVF